MIQSQRHLFDIPDDVAYLNCAYMSPLMRAVVDAGVQGIRRKARPWLIRAQDFFPEVATARALFADIIHAQSDDIAIVPAVSYGIAVAANNLPVGRGQTIVVLADQFPSNVYAWKVIAKERRANLLTVPRPDDGRWSEATLEAIDENTAVAALPHCHWTDGSLLDLVAIGARCREIGAALVLDLTQSAGALTFDVRQVQPDFLVAASYKWLLGPYALGFLYVAPHWQQGSPLEHNWITRAGSENFARLVDYQDRFEPGAQRFDMGERSNFHLMPMAVAALRQIQEWGIGAIEATLAQKTDAIVARAEQLDLSAAPSDLRAGHFLGLRFPQGLPMGLMERLNSHNVYVSIRGDSMRVTPHLYNTDDDIERLFAALLDAR